MTLAMRFDGETYSPIWDGERLKSQFERVRDLMIDGAWRGLAEIAEAVCGSEAGVSARLRDLRKERFGGFVVNRRARDRAHGIWEYQVLNPFDSMGQGRLF